MRWTVVFLLAALAALAAAGTGADPPAEPDLGQRFAAVETEWLRALDARRGLLPPGVGLSAAEERRLADAYRSRFDELARDGSLRAAAWVLALRVATEEPAAFGPALVRLAAAAPGPGELAPYDAALAAALREAGRGESGRELAGWLWVAAEAAPALGPALRRAALEARLAHAADDAERSALADELERVAANDPEAGWARRARWRLANLAPGLLAPDFQTFDADRNEVRLSDLRGRTVAVAFWRADDPAADLGALADLAVRHRDRDFLVLGVATGSDVPAYRRRTNVLPFDWVHALEPADGPAAAAWRVDARPFVVLLGPDGRVLELEPSPALLVDAVERSLASAVPPRAGAGF